ncbi:type II toxin-antitoxin system VapC family toxin [Rhodohalobacter sp.]|uniref:type II toxin-antitoxin system VapC family toxin n=1 Tax=Rhodohalobacter sp. TaxID=1974210 RepID=UPI002ACEF40C|nr:type II toxin-antitoxin system VapC family toxin [Rhodohalobacter sp.]MDZ7757774.1 type II toxin-antitoxin system VapC family toxin [Rhodohalobacter sp.]
MSYLIDTCCISELVKKKPNSNVLKWFADQDELSMYLSVITFGELRKGIEKLPDSKKKKELNQWVKEDLNHRFKNRVLNINMEEVNRWGKILATAEKNGKPLPAIDSLIAATAQVHDLSVVTRNTQDMEGSGVEVINPWIYEPNT